VSTASARSATEPRDRAHSAAAATLDETKLRKEHAMVKTGLIVRLDARAGKEEELAAFLVDALPLVENEPQTTAWFAVRTSDASFAIVDVFPDEAGRQAHLDGPVAAALIEKATELLVRAPEIERVDVLAAKLSATSAA
jgi:quinol monooxygenase YgiN